MKKYISIQVAVAVTLLALGGSIAVSIFYYYLSYAVQVRESQRTLLQLGQTVQSTSSIAAYLSDKELAKEVVQGLRKNMIVASAQLKSTSGMRIPVDEVMVGDARNIVSIKLESPFIPGELVGELLISVNQQLIDERARESAWSNAAMLGGYTLFVSLLVFLLIQWRFINGIKQVASNLSHIVPGEAGRLACPEKHQEDEVGGLVGNINKLLGMVQEKFDNERALHGQIISLEKRYRMIYEGAGVGIFLMDHRARLAMGNLAFIEIVGAELYGKVLNDDVNCLMGMLSETERTLSLIEEILTQSKLAAGDFLLKSEMGESRWVHCILTQVRDDASEGADGEIFIQGILTDITERKIEEQRMRYQAERDPLTNLFNRRSAEHSLKLLLEKSAFEGSKLAVCLVDLDNFKPINDTHGHEAGDIVLATTAKRMIDTLRSTDLIARLGGDEFLLVLQGANVLQDFEDILDKLIGSLTQEISIGNDIFVKIGVSIGVAMSPDHGSAYDDLMVKADQAMYQVKRNGKMGYQFYA